MDLDRLGRWLYNRPHKPINNHWNPAKAISTIATKMTQDELDDGHSLAQWELTRRKNRSPAALRGYLKKGRKAGWPRYKDLTPYRIERFFKPLKVVFKDE